nr:hypothetical protein [Piscirickettsia salmonis]
MVEVYCNANVCQAYIDQCLIPCLSPGETVIMDNASFHNQKGLRKRLKMRVVTYYFHPLILLI